MPSPALTLAQAMACTSNSPYGALRCPASVLARRWGANQSIHNTWDDLPNRQAGHSAQQGQNAPSPGSAEGANCRHGGEWGRLRQQGRPSFRGNNNDRHVRQRPLWAGADAGPTLITQVIVYHRVVPDGPNRPHPTGVFADSTACTSFQIDANHAYPLWRPSHLAMALAPTSTEPTAST